MILRKVAPTLVFTFSAYGGLNHVILLFLFLLFQLHQLHDKLHFPSCYHHWLQKDHFLSYYHTHLIMEVQFTFPNLLIMEEQVSVKPCCLSLGQVGKIRYKQEGPSLESSSYLNVSLRYLGPWNPGTLGPLDHGTLGPWDSWTSSLLQHLLILPLTSSYLLLFLPPTLLLWYHCGTGWT